MTHNQPQTPNTLEGYLYGIATTGAILALDTWLGTNLTQGDIAYLFLTLTASVVMWEYLKTVVTDR